jgi:hypothetical protein
MNLAPVTGETPRPIDRRTAIKWLLTATAATTLLERASFGATAAQLDGKGYGPNPDVQKTYQPGELWPLTFSPAQRRTAAVLCDTIIPADTESPSASQVGVVDFIDEWISAPYAREDGDFPFRRDHTLIVEGLAWLDTEGIQRFGHAFADLTENQRASICDDICHEKDARTDFKHPARFFARYRDLTSGGFYTTPEGMKDLKYIGNVPLVSFDGAPPEVLKRIGLA